MISLMPNQGWRWAKLKTSKIWWPGCGKVGENKVIIGGGFDANSALYLMQGGRWPRRSFHIFIFNYDAGDLTTLALGGRDNDGNKLNTVEEWKAKTETIDETIEAGLKVKRYAFGLVALQRTLENQGERFSFLFS